MISLLKRTVMMLKTGQNPELISCSWFSWSERPNEVIMNAAITNHSEQIITRNLPQPGTGKNTESSNSNFEIYLFKLWNLSQKKKGREKDRKKEERKQKSQQVNHQQVAKSKSPVRLSSEAEPPEMTSVYDSARWAGISSSFCSYTDETPVLVLTRWDSSHALQRVSHLPVNSTMHQKYTQLT